MFRYGITPPVPDDWGGGGATTPDAPVQGDTGAPTNTLVTINAKGVSGRITVGGVQIVGTIPFPGGGGTGEPPPVPGAPTPTPRAPVLGDGAKTALAVGGGVLGVVVLMRLMG